MTRAEVLAKARAAKAAKAAGQPTGLSRRERNEAERQRVRELLKPPDDVFVIDGVDYALDCQNPRSGQPLVTISSILQDRVSRLAQVMDGSMIALQQEAQAARKRGDAVAFTLINGKLLDHTTRVLTSPAAMSLKADAALYDLDQFTPETRAKLVEAFEAAERELRAKGEAEG